MILLKMKLQLLEEQQLRRLPSEVYYPLLILQFGPPCARPKMSDEKMLYFIIDFVSAIQMDFTFNLLAYTALKQIWCSCSAYFSFTKQPANQLLFKILSLECLLSACSPSGFRKYTVTSFVAPAELSAIAT
jgi:hypothetical protein